MTNKTICVVGHRNVELTYENLNKLKEFFETLIVKEEAKTFLFGSKSNFDSICHNVITELKLKYPYIRRKCYCCRSESCVLESEKQYWEKVYSNLYHKNINLYSVEEEVEYKNKWTSSKASYIERNFAMIDASDICVFYYDENYKPSLRKYSKKCIGYYQPTSGTALAYKYAKQKNKIIYNVLNFLNLS